MPYDVFISYSSKNKQIAEAVRETLEAESIKCWIAPRDIVPGVEWSEAIINAIQECRVMVLIFSSDANQSQQVKREAERAINRGLILIPLRVEDVFPSGAMEYYLSTSHWMDAVSPPIENHLQHLRDTVKLFLSDHKTVTAAEQASLLGSLRSASDSAPASGETPKRLDEEDATGITRGFNWGAFLLNRSWLGAHNIYAGFWVGLLLLGPYIGILLFLIFGTRMLWPALVCGLGLVAWLVLGFRGNELAWHNRRWINANHFRKVQWGWAVRAFSFWVVVAVLVGLFVQSGLNRSVQAYASSMAARGMKNPAVVGIRKKAERTLTTGGNQSNSQNSNKTKSSR